MILRHKLIILLATAVVLMLMVLATVQMRQGQRFIVQTAEDRVARHIETAWQILELQQRELTVTVDLLTCRSELLDDIREQQSLDVLTTVDPDAPPPGTVAGAVARRYPVLDSTTLSGIISIDAGDLRNEREILRERCVIGGELAPSMAIFATRVHEDGGVLVAAQILTRSDELLWRIQRGLFGDEYYEGQRTGTVTFFTGTRRTSTTVLKDDHTSAVGTDVSNEVAQQVLVEERSWIGPAVVVGVRYLSRYDPIRDPGGSVIGMLYVGELESRFLDRKYQTVVLGTGSIVAVLLLTGLGAWIIFRIERQADAHRRRVRFDFLRVLGHELKAPINAVEGYLLLMNEETLGPIPDAYGKMVDRSVQRIKQMRQLIAELLDLTRIEAGEKRRVITDGVDLVVVVNQSLETVQTEATARNISIKVEAPHALPMRADSGELAIVCNNLLTNAVKYNREGGVVKVKLARDGGRITLAVQDTGIGMTEEDLQRLFGEFVRIKNEKTQHILGSGLGLNILKKTAKLYGGDVAVESEPDVGSTFTVTLFDAN